MATSYNGAVMVKWGQTFRVRFCGNAQTPPSGRSRNDLAYALFAMSRSPPERALKSPLNQKPQLIMANT
jgi:hypothetical protein